MAAYTDIISIVVAAVLLSSYVDSGGRFVCCSAVWGRCLAGKVRKRADHRNHLSLQLAGDVDWAGTLAIRLH